MASPETADASMRQVVEALKSSQLRKLDDISRVGTMLALLEGLSGRNWYTTYSQLHEKWTNNDAEALAVEQANREALKL